MNQTQAVHIIGAGWSGLACAVTLAKAGIPVQLLESASQAGGRARTVHYQKSFPDTLLDNGQHIMLGAYRQTLALFKQLGINEADVLYRQKLSLVLYSPHVPVISLDTSQLPAPCHLIHALLNFKNIAWKDRFSVIRMLARISFKRFQLTTDISVYELLKHYHQSKRLIEALWEPLCLATMNTPIKEASAQIFLTILETSFNRKNQDSDLLFFKSDLSAVFCNKAIQFIKQHNGSILYAHRVKRIEVNNKFRQFIIHTNNKLIPATTIVLATPAYVSEKILKSAQQEAVIKLKPGHSSLRFSYQPIYTIYLQYPQAIKFEQIMTGFFGTLSQWAIDHRINNQPGLIAVVISSSGRHLELSDKQLVETIHNELKLVHQHLPQWLNYQIVREKRATFNCTININTQRPDFKTSCKELFLAGDYTNTRYPATLEGAVVSGVRVAQHIINTAS